jgi:Ca-activated chloride channel family protein
MTQIHLPFTPAWLGWANPWAFALLLLLPLLWWIWSLASRRPVIRFSSLAHVRATTGTQPRARRILHALRTLAIVFLIVACARPQKADESSRVFAEGVAIQLVVDVSSSMGDFDLSPPDAKDKLDRLALVKQIVRQFVLGKEAGGELPGRPNDLVGLIRFARYADSVCPLTLDHKNLVSELDATHWIGEALLREIQKMQEQGGPTQRYNQLVDRFRQLNQTEDGTNIGGGLALAVERLKDLKRTTGSGEQLKIKSRIVVLLTDGENNVEEIVNRTGMEPSLVTISPVQAGELAAKDGIKVYTIAAGTGALEQRYDMFNNLVRSNRRPLNDADLRKIAELTGGKHFVATDRQSLENIYEEIDKLERSRIEERSYVRWSELAWPWLLASFSALGLQTLLDATRMRKIP